MKKNEKWHLYIIVCKDKTYYTGITKDLARRVKQHSEGKGARYTRSHGVFKLAYTESFTGFRKAALREIAIKKLSRLAKQKLFASKKGL